MQVLYPHCAGLDVHKDTVVACVRHMIGGTVKREVRTFDTTTKGLLALADWLASEDHAPGRVIRGSSVGRFGWSSVWLVRRSVSC
jgi:hypothetical protein